MAGPVYQNRVDAGKKLASLLDVYRQQAGLLVLALPRGGVPVAYEVAQYLQAPLDVFIVRKLGVPGQEELAMGALASGGGRVLNMDVIRHHQISPDIVEQATQRESQEIARREQLYRPDQPPLQVHERTLILIDDGLATGATMRAAVLALRQLGPRHLVVAVPVAAPVTCHDFSQLADACICAYTPDPLYGVGWWYQDFTQTSDDEVCALLALNRQQYPLTN